MQTAFQERYREIRDNATALAAKDLEAAIRRIEEETKSKSEEDLSVQLKKIRAEAEDQAQLAAGVKLAKEFHFMKTQIEVIKVFLVTLSLFPI